eukprot:sb/3468186/
MPLKTHRVNMIHVYEEAFKREDAQKWLVEFIRDSELLKPISIENAGLLLDKFTGMGIIEQVCSTKSWLRTPTVIYKFSSVDQSRVEKLRSLRYYSRTPTKGTSVTVPPPAPSHPLKTIHPSQQCNQQVNPAPLAARNNLIQYEASPAPPSKGKENKEDKDQLCTPCKKRRSSFLPQNPMFSSTPNKGIMEPSPYTRALETIRKSRDRARRLKESKSTGVKRLGNRGPHTKDPDLGTPSGERLLSTKSGCPLNWDQIRLISYIGGKKSCP